MTIVRQMDGLLFQDFVIDALLASVVMGVVLAYLGVHVVERGIVFVDLALGQISMMGVAAAAYFHMDPTVVSVVFTLVGAFLLSLIKVTDPRLKQEAIIGIVYAFTSAVTVLLISKAAHGDSDISEVLFGSLFTVTRSQFIIMSVTFGAVGVVHFVFRRRFYDLTEKFARDNTSGIGFFNIWNFLFYLTLGLAIVLGVRIGGVIPVFAFIVVPPVAAMLLTRGRTSLIVYAVLLSVVGSVLGIQFSVQFDFPAGASLVSILGALFLAAAAIRLLRGRPRQPVLDTETERTSA